MAFALIYIKETTLLRGEHMATQKVTVNLPEDLIAFLRKTSEKEDITFTDALRRAISSERFFSDQESQGRMILIEGKDPKIREIVRK